MRTLRGAGWYLTSILITIVFLFPVYWMFAVSLKTPQEIFKFPPAWYPRPRSCRTSSCCSATATSGRSGTAW